MSTPVVSDLTVIPIAGRDSMLLNLSGAHGPFFTRNLVILDRLRRQHRCRRGARRRADPPHPRGRPRDRRPAAASATTTPCSPTCGATFADRDAGGRGAQTFDLRVDGARRDRCRVGVARPARPAPRGAGGRAARRRAAARPRAGAGLPVLRRRPHQDRPGLPVARPTRLPAPTSGCKVRHEEALTPDAVVRLAEAARDALRVPRLQAQGRGAARAPTRPRRSSRWPTASPTPESRWTPTADGCSTTRSRRAAS